MVWWKCHWLNHNVILCVGRLIKGSFQLIKPCTCIPTLLPARNNYVMYTSVHLDVSWGYNYGEYGLFVSMNFLSYELRSHCCSIGTHIVVFNCMWCMWVRISQGWKWVTPVDPLTHRAMQMWRTYDPLLFCYPHAEVFFWKVMQQNDTYGKIIILIWNNATDLFILGRIQNWTIHRLLDNKIFEHHILQNSKLVSHQQWFTRRRVHSLTRCQCLRTCDLLKIWVTSR